VAAIGPGTAAALAERGINADVLPERALAESLVEALAGVPVARALVARGRGGREVLPDALRERGAEVEVLEPYETVAEPLAAGALREAAQADYITFTSSSTVRFFLAAAASSAGVQADERAQAGERPVAGPLAPGTRVASIGPVTSATLREHGLRVDVEADQHDVEGLVRALLADADGAR
jgi:uroporphyrinogen III methyltransferase/synthase